MRKGQIVAMVRNGPGGDNAVSIERIERVRDGSVKLVGYANLFPSGDPSIEVDGVQYLLYPLNESRELCHDKRMQNLGLTSHGPPPTDRRLPGKKNRGRIAAIIEMRPKLSAPHVVGDFTVVTARGDDPGIINPIRRDRGGPVRYGTVHFFSPHPGLLGAAARLPDKLVKLARRITGPGDDGRRGLLQTTRRKIESVARKVLPSCAVIIHAPDGNRTPGCILVKHRNHCWRIVQWAAIDEATQGKHK